MRMNFAGLALIGLLAATPALAGSQTFNGPTHRNLPIDKCMGPGGPCGKATANAFCKTKGFKLANKYSLLNGTQKTAYLGGTACARRDCNGFASIACDDSLDLKAGSSSDWGSVGD